MPLCHHARVPSRVNSRVPSEAAGRCDFALRRSVALTCDRWTCRASWRRSSAQRRGCCALRMCGTAKVHSGHTAREPIGPMSSCAALRCAALCLRVMLYCTDNGCVGCALQWLMLPWKSTRTDRCTITGRALPSGLSETLKPKAIVTSPVRSESTSRIAATATLRYSVAAAPSRQRVQRSID